MHPRFAVALLLGLLLFIAGCSDGSADRDSVDPDPPAEGSLSDGSSGDPPEGKQWIVSPAGLQFALPDSWDVINRSTVDDPDNAPEIAAYAEAHGEKESEIRAGLGRTDQLVVDREGTSIYVVGEVGRALPTEDQVRAGLTTADGFEPEVETVVTTVGDAITIGSVLHVEGNPIYARAVIVGTERGVSVLQISTTDYTQLAVFESEVFSSLSDVG